MRADIGYIPKTLAVTQHFLQFGLEAADLAAIARKQHQVANPAAGLNQSGCVQIRFIDQQAGRNIDEPHAAIRPVSQDLGKF